MELNMLNIVVNSTSPFSVLNIKFQKMQNFQTI